MSHSKSIIKQTNAMQIIRIFEFPHESVCQIIIGNVFSLKTQVVLMMSVTKEQFFLCVYPNSNVKYTLSCYQGAQLR